MAGPHDLDSARDAFRRQAWGEAYERFTGAAPLAPEDLESLASVASLTGRETEALEAWTRAHNEYLRRAGPGDIARAGRCASWLAFRSFVTGEHARAGGWLSRALRLCESAPDECVERGYLQLPLGMRAAVSGDAAGARELFRQAAQVAERFGDRDLLSMARLGEGRSLIRMGEAGQGIALLDEIMIAIEAGEVSPVLVGDMYCSVISACGEIFDLRRAQEWTAALSQWCDSQPELATHRGECLVRRAELMRLHGAWGDALLEAGRACELVAEPPTRDPAVGAAFYQCAELHRLRGDFDAAESEYRAASRWGRNPQPGLALLRLATGQTDVAEAAIRRAIDEVRDRVTRSAVLAAGVEIALAAGDVASARARADELACIAGTVGAPYLRALSAGALGAVLLAEGDPRSAMEQLRAAAAAWQELEAPYETARARMLVSAACRALGDDESHALELDAARSVFEKLGAAPDLERLSAFAAPAAAVADGLTGREVEVLRLVAGGKTNRAIATQLFISEKTVARHLSNIFGKLGLSSRSAATAYAFRNELVDSRG